MDQPKSLSSLSSNRQKKLHQRKKRKIIKSLPTFPFQKALFSPLDPFMFTSYFKQDVNDKTTSNSSSSSSSSSSSFTSSSSSSSSSSSAPTGVIITASTPPAQATTPNTKIIEKKKKTMAELQQEYNLQYNIPDQAQDDASMIQLMTTLHLNGNDETTKTIRNRFTYDLPQDPGNRTNNKRPRYALPPSWLAGPSSTKRRGSENNVSLLPTQSQSLNSQQLVLSQSFLPSRTHSVLNRRHAKINRQASTSKLEEIKGQIQSGQQVKNDLDRQIAEQLAILRQDQDEAIDEKHALGEKRRQALEDLDKRMAGSDLHSQAASAVADSLISDYVSQLTRQTIALAKRKIPLTPEELTVVTEILNEPGNRVLIDKFNIEMTTEYISCLDHLVWLNDEVINFYMELLRARDTKKRCHFFNSFFYPKLGQGGGYQHKNVKRWSKKAKIKIIELDRVFAPVHVGNNHWCMAVINFVDKRFEYYDSLGGSNRTLLKALRQYVKDEAKLYSQIDDYNTDDWEDYTPRDIPRQHNGCDCGVFAVKYADYLSEGCPLDFHQRDMPYFRKRMILQILAARVL